MFGLSFLYPLFLAAAAAVAVPIVLHLFRRRTDIVIDFPAVRLLQKAPVEQQRRRRLREFILLALRVAALALLAFAFARPYFAATGSAIAVPVTVVALDTSMSLSAPGQFDAARQAARRAIDNTPPTHLTGLVTFDDNANLVVRPTSDRGGVLAAIDAAKPGANGTRFRTALARSAEAIGDATGRIVVITDLQQSGWEASDVGTVPDGVNVEIADVPSPEGNLAVTAVRRDGQAVLAAIHNYGPKAAPVTARLRIEGREVVSARADVAPHSAAEIRLTATLPPRGAAEVSIEDRLGYQADNSRYFLLDPPAAVPVFVITADPPTSSNAGLYVERALSVADDGRAFRVRVVDGRAFSALSEQELGQATAFILLGTRTLDRKGRDTILNFLRGGGRVLLSLGPDVDLDTLRDTVGAEVGAQAEPVSPSGGRVTLIAVDARHPVFRPFSTPTGALGDVYVDQYRRLSDQKDRIVLARFSGGDAALTEQAVEGGRLLVFATDLDNRWNRFPLNPAFVPFAIETARYLTVGREVRQMWTLPEMPTGLTVPSGTAAAGPGVFTVGGRGGDLHRVAVNVDVKESNPARTTAEEFTQEVMRRSQTVATAAGLAAREQEERQRLWQIGLLVMFVALALEGVIGRKAA